MDAVHGLRRRFVVGPAGSIAVVTVALMASGCKSGAWNAKPSWWAFGQAAPGGASSLASAPAFEGDVTKPSATAKPYPTTSTPQAYALDAKPAPSAATADVQQPVTYGSTPPPANLAQWGNAAAQPSMPGGRDASPIRPQVGPYAASNGGAGERSAAVAAQAPAAQSPSGWSPTSAAAPAAATVTSSPPAYGAALAEPPLSDLPSGAPGGSPPGAPGPRVADARAASPGWTGSGGDASLPSPPADSRYASGSRFSDGQAALAPSVVAPPPAGPLPAEVKPLDSPPPMTAPPVPSAAPARRPDPGYRPGGTSSYRPGRTSIAAGPEAGGVQPASFAAPVANGE